MRFLPYQQRWIADRSRLKLLEKSRQIGMTWATAYAVVTRQAEPDARLDAWVASRDEVQARLFLDDCRKFAGILDRAARATGATDAAVLPEDFRARAQALPLVNGRRIHSLSSNPDAQAGKRGPRVLDEFALHLDPRRLYAIAYPGITWGGQLEILSTHRGAQNYFNQLVVEARHGGNPKNFSLHRVTLQDALDQGFLARLQEKLPADDPRRAFDNAAYYDFIRASCADEETFLQEYMCAPADESTAFLPWDLLAAGEYNPGEYTPFDFAREKNPPRAPARDLYLGVDIGRVHDLTVFWLLERGPGGIHLTRDVLTLENHPFARQEELLWERLALPGLRRACLDATGLGRQLAERALERFGQFRVEPVTFTAPVKEDLAYGLRTLFEKRALRIPHDKNIRADLRAIKKTATSAGNIRFAADRGPGGHADLLWALALAAFAARTPTAAHRYESAAALGTERKPRQLGW
jgi:phage FluMu gp28-like protein